VTTLKTGYKIVERTVLNVCQHLVHPSVLLFIYSFFINTKMRFLFEHRNVLICITYSASKHQYLYISYQPNKQFELFLNLIRPPSANLEFLGLNVWEIKRVDAFQTFIKCRF